jgi:hypothetical protein
MVFILMFRPGRAAFQRPGAGRGLDKKFTARTMGLTDNGFRASGAG